ncbi:MAG: HK97 gp10 family phage protein [Clostridiales bacterium]|nr:HK97 gp10 family phage protein [Clostridiales bacterium]
MGRMGSFDSGDFKKLQRKLEKIKQSDIDEFIEGCAKELAARLLAKVIKNTPVGDYSTEVKIVAKRDSKKHKKGDVYTKKVNKSGKTGGTLRRGWTASSAEEATEGSGKKLLSVEQATEYVNSLEIKKNGDMFSIEIINPVEYASYVEYGHRTPNHKGWVKGQFMLTISEKEVERIAPKVLEARLK